MVASKGLLVGVDLPISVFGRRTSVIGNTHTSHLHRFWCPFYGRFVWFVGADLECQYVVIKDVCCWDQSLDFDGIVSVGVGNISA